MDTCIFSTRANQGLTIALYGEYFFKNADFKGYFRIKLETIKTRAEALWQV